MNGYEERQERRRQRYEELAVKAEERSNAAYKRSREIADGIPLGQPILVGHHSEKRHRADIRRIHRAMDTSVSEAKKAKYYEQKVASVGTGGISADDPDAIDKLTTQLATLRERQEDMKAVNKEFRRCKGDVDVMDIPARFKEAIKRTFKLAPWIKRPFTFEITNNGANIKRIERRIAQLTARTGTTQQWEFEGFTVVANTEENRLQILYPGKPSEEVRTTLKAHGFRWSRYQGAWQRQLNNAAIHNAEHALGAILEGYHV